MVTIRPTPSVADQDRDLAESILRTLTPLHTPDLSGFYSADGVVLVQALNWNTGESTREVVPARGPRTGHLTVSWLRLDNRKQLARELGLRPSDASDLTDPDLVLAAYDRWGDQTASRLDGDFAFAVFEPITRRLYLARDRMGIRPLYYALTRDAVAFTTTLAAFRAMPGIDTSISRKWLAHYLGGFSESVPGLTAFEHAIEVPPGHCVTIHDGRAVARKYHEFRDDPPWSDTNDEQYVEKYREEFLRSVLVRMRSAYPLGAENSGGLDSASVIAAYRISRGDYGHLETFGMPQYSLDEHYMRVALEGTRYRLHIFDRSGSGSFEAAMDAATILGHPPEIDCSYYWSPFLQRAAELGVRTILSGNGGDDAATYTGNLLLRELALRGDISRLREAHFGSSPIGFAKALRFVGLQHRRGRYHPQMHKAVMGNLRDRGLSSEALHDLGVMDQALKLSRGTVPHDTINSLVLGHMLVGTPTRRAAESCQVGFAHKVEYRYPMLDARLIQRYLSTPSIEKRTRGLSRSLHRRAMSGMVPDAIRTMPDKNAGEMLTENEPDLDPYRVTREMLQGTAAEGLLDDDRWRKPRGRVPGWHPSADVDFRLLVLFRSKNT